MAEKEEFSDEEHLPRAPPRPKSTVAEKLFQSGVSDLSVASNGSETEKKPTPKAPFGEWKRSLVAIRVMRRKPTKGDDIKGMSGGFSQNVTQKTEKQTPMLNYNSPQKSTQDRGAKVMIKTPFQNICEETGEGAGVFHFNSMQRSTQNQGARGKVKNPFQRVSEEREKRTRVFSYNPRLSAPLKQNIARFAKKKGEEETEQICPTFEQSDWKFDKKIEEESRNPFSVNDWKKSYLPFKGKNIMEGQVENNSSQQGKYEEPCLCSGWMKKLESAFEMIRVQNSRINSMQNTIHKILKIISELKQKVGKLENKADPGLDAFPRDLFFSLLNTLQTQSSKLDELNRFAQKYDQQQKARTEESAQKGALEPTPRVIIRRAVEYKNNSTKEEKQKSCLNENENVCVEAKEKSTATQKANHDETENLPPTKSNIPKLHSSLKQSDEASCSEDQKCIEKIENVCVEAKEESTADQKANNDETQNLPPTSDTSKVHSSSGQSDGAGCSSGQKSESSSPREISLDKSMEIERLASKYLPKGKFSDLLPFSKKCPKEDDDDEDSEKFKNNFFIEAHKFHDKMKKSLKAKRNQNKPDYETSSDSSDTSFELDLADVIRTMGTLPKYD